MRRRAGAWAATITIAAGTVLGLTLNSGPVAATTAASCALPASGTTFGAATPQAENLDPAAVRDGDRIRRYPSATVGADLPEQLPRRRRPAGCGHRQHPDGDLQLDEVSHLDPDRHRLGPAQARARRPHRKVPADGPGWGTQPIGRSPSGTCSPRHPGLDESILSRVRHGRPSTRTSPKRRWPSRSSTRPARTSSTASVTRTCCVRGAARGRRGLAGVRADSTCSARSAYRRTATSGCATAADNTYGYANLFIPPTQFAKLGLLMQNDGIWRGRRILSTSYIDAGARRTAGPTRATDSCSGTTAARRAPGATFRPRRPSPGRWSAARRPICSRWSAHCSRTTS